MGGGGGVVVAYPADLSSFCDFFTQNTEASPLGPSATSPTAESANLVTEIHVSAFLL